LGVDSDGVRHAATVDLHRGAIDVIQGVGGLVVVGVEGLIRLATPSIGLSNAHFLLGAGVDAARGYAGQREAAVVGPTLEIDVFGRLSGTLQIIHQGAFDSR
jgi:hypothetical protein